MLSAILILFFAAQSLVVWGMITQRWSRGEAALDRVTPNSSPFLGLAATAAGLFVGMLLSYSLDSQLNGDRTLPLVSVHDVQMGSFNGAIEILIALALLTGGGRVPFADIGLHLRHVNRQLIDGLVGFLASFGPVFLVLFITSALRTEENQHPYLQLLGRDPSSITVGWLLLAAVVVAPIKEELIFRVMLQDGLARKVGSAPAIGITSLLFCAVHGFPDSIALLPLAIVLGYVYDRRQSILTVIVIHALFNLTNIVLLLSEPT